ncbi:MAG: hypothetical protein CFH10_01077 [Alphaproteobacteria bacterium MarineAlpha4_Bin2]|nr:MAG: hypothetical protein CFH10_01077 [Alphaproteobacteria bacterium MarineAlpha4_Bin2]|tara:strand:- start:527 stop:1066 length:540 start_codon:yes stop_codon:yes gene_type:complete
MASLLKKLFRNSDGMARKLYSKVVKRARRAEYFHEWSVPDTPNGRFEVLALHLFLVMYRLRSEEGLSNFARALSEEAVLDMDRNLREMGVGDLSVGRKVKSLAEALYGRFGAYADGIEGDDEVLSEALCRNFFADFGGTDDAVLAVVHFMRSEAKRLASLNASCLLEARLCDEGLPNVS